MKKSMSTYPKRKLKVPDVVQQGIIGELTWLRLEEGLNTSELSKLVGYSSRSMYTWEAGETSPRLAAVVDWADYFGYELQLVRKEE